VAQWKDFVGGPIWWHNKSKMADHNFVVDQHFCTKFYTEMENRQPKGSQCSKGRFSKIQDGGRPPSWISILGHNFGVNQHFWVFSLLDQLRRVLHSGWGMTPKLGVARVTCPTFEAMGQIPMFHRTYFLLFPRISCTFLSHVSVFTLYVDNFGCQMVSSSSLTILELELLAGI